MPRANKQQVQPPVDSFGAALLPVAGVFVRHKWKHETINGNVTKIHVGKEYVRVAGCLTHKGKDSTDFRGVVVGGWLFYCKGIVGERGGSHVFIAQPCKLEVD